MIQLYSLTILMIEGIIFCTTRVVEMPLASTNKIITRLLQDKLNYCKR